MKRVKELSWQEFADLEEVQIDESPIGYGNAMFYNDGLIQVSIDIKKSHDDATVWEDSQLFEELQQLVIEAKREV